MVKVADVLRRTFNKRVAKWDESHPQFAGMGSAQNLHEKLRTYILTVKHDEGDNEFVTMDEIMQRYATHDVLIRDVLEEIQLRYEQEVELMREEPDPNTLREAKGRDILKELSDLDLAEKLKGSSAFTPSSKEGPSDNPLMNQVDQELKRKSGLISSPRIAKVGNHTVYNPANVDEESKEASLQTEMEKIIAKLLPADNYVIAEKIRPEYDKYLSHMKIQAELEVEE